MASYVGTVLLAISKRFATWQIVMSVRIRVVTINYTVFISQELEETISATKRDLESMERSKAAIECRASELDASLSLSRTEVASLRTALSQTMANMSAVQSELEATKVDLPISNW